MPRTTSKPRRTRAGRDGTAVRGYPVRVDSKGRLSIPSRVRQELNVQPGDTFFVVQEGHALRYVKAPPIDVLAEHAIREYRTGKTTSLRDLAREEGITLGDE